MDLKLPPKVPSAQPEDDAAALRAKAEKACQEADPDWHTMHYGEQEARIASWIEGYRTAAQEHFDYSAGMNAMLRINNRLLVANAALRRDALQWRSHAAEQAASRVLNGDSPDAPASAS